MFDLKAPLQDLKPLEVTRPHVVIGDALRAARQNRSGVAELAQLAIPDQIVQSTPGHCSLYNVFGTIMTRPAILLAVAVGALDAQAPAGLRTQAIEISGAIEAPVRLDAAQLAALPKKTETLRLTEGRAAVFEGATLGAVLQMAGVRMGDSLKGDRLAGFVLVEGAGGYRAVFALPELDSTFTDEPVLLAMKRDGSPLTAAEGPFRIIVPKEKKQSPWIRQVVAIRILRAEDALEE